MSGEYLKEFLVALGFQIDANGQRKFVESIKAATVQAQLLAEAIKDTAEAVVAGVEKMSTGLEQLYFASQRTKSSVDNIQAAQYAATQLGSSAEGALAAIESVARFMRVNPGGEGLIHSLGVQTRDANGELRDTTEILGDLGSRLKAMPYYRAKSYADVLGIDERTLMAMREGLGGFSDAYRAKLRAMGVDAQEASAGAHQFMTKLRELRATAEIVGLKIGSTLQNGLSKSVEKLDAFLEEHSDQIAGFFNNVAAVIEHVSERIGDAVGDVVDWWDRLDESSRTGVKGIAAITAAFVALNAVLSASPLGLLALLAAGLFLLYDDYKTWKAGGQSLIDWSKWEPGIKAAIAAFNTILGWIGQLVDAVGGWKTVLEVLAAYVAASWAASMVGGIGKVLGAVTGLGGEVDGLIGKMGKLSTASKAGLLGVAAVAGYKIGTAINDKFIKDTAVGDWIGRIGNGLLALGGNKDARNAIIAEARAKRLGLGGVETERENHAQAAPPRMTGQVNFKSVPIGGLAPAPVAATRPVHATRGERNNNPGNLNYARQTGASLEDHGDDSRFASFASAQEGLNALARQLQLYAVRGVDSIKSIIEKYAPAGENNTQAYIASVAKRLGMDENAHLNLSDPAVMQGMLDAIIRVENGRNIYSRDMLARASGGDTVTTNAPTINQTTTIHVQAPAGADARAIAQTVSTEQNGVNSRLVRMQGAVVG